MSEMDYDVLVIGGGPGGSCAAAFARQKGLRVLVAEKTQFPRFHIGESLLPMGNAVLRETGVWPKVQAAGFMPKYGAEFHTADGALEQHVVFSESMIPGLDSAYQVERARFDSLLLDHARELGAEVRMGTTVRSTETIEGGHRATLLEPAGERTVTAAWVLDSTGRDPSLMTEQKRALDPCPFPKRIAIYSHFRGVVRAPGREAGNILVVRLKGGWFWIIPLDAEKTSVGIVTEVDIFKQSGLPPEDFFRKAIADSSKLTAVLGRAEAMMGFHVTSDYSYFRKTLARERLLLIGDAAGFLDPVFSSGVHMATWSAKVAVATLAPAHAQQRGLTPREQRRYTRQIKRHASVFRKLIAAFYDDPSFEVFMCQEIPEHLSGAMTSIVAGHAHLPWPLWWRYHLFLLVCRLQRRWKLVK